VGLANLKVKLSEPSSRAISSWLQNAMHMCMFMLKYAIKKDARNITIISSFMARNGEVAVAYYYYKVQLKAILLLWVPRLNTPYVGM